MAKSDDDVMTTLVAGALSVPFVGGMFIAAILLDGWALFILWGWFVVPVFALPALTVSQAIGISLVAGFLAHQFNPTPEGKTWARIAFTFTHPLMVLGVGWCVKYWNT